MDGDPPARPRRRRVLAAVVGTAAALAAAEGLLRWTGAGTYQARETTFEFTHNTDRRFWVVNDGLPATHRWDGDPYGHLPPGEELTYEVNGLGLRGPLPPAGRKCVLVLGDSFTFGEGVRLEDTFVARLSRRSEAAGPAAPVFVNAAVPGYSTIEEAAWGPRMLDRFRPAAVVVVYTANDAIPFVDMPSVDRVAYDPEAGRPPLRLMELAGRVLGRARENREMEDWYLSYYVGARSAGFESSRLALENIQAAAHARRAAFGVVYFPLVYRVGDARMAPIADTLSAAAQRMGIPFLDLTPSLARASDAELTVHPTDLHPSARAHEIAAEAMAPFVEGLLR